MPNACLRISLLGHCQTVIVYTVLHRSVFLVIINNLNELRWLTCIELYEKANFYCQQRVLLECLKVRSSVYSNFDSIFSCCLF